MYGQGNYAPQFRHGPPSVPHFQQSPPPPPPPFQQAPPGSRPPAIQQVPPYLLTHQAPPGPPYLHQPMPVHGSVPMVPSYNQPGPPYPSPMTNQNVHHVQQPVPPPPPRVLPSPPFPLQGQVLHMTPPPPLGIQHVLTPPPPPPSSFISITPVPLASFGDAHPPSLLPPPPPPSSPPPVPPSPPPPSSPMTDLSLTVSKAVTMDSVMDVACASEYVAVDGPVGSTQLTDDVLVHSGFPHGEVGNLEKVVSRGEGEASEDLASPPPKPAEEVVQNIEVLCQFIAKAGPDFENMARRKEADNRQFSFLFGGEPGSAAAIAHEYFQWMKMKYRLELNSCSNLEQNAPSSGPLEVECFQECGSLLDSGAAISPAESDMDMEDDDGDYIGQYTSDGNVQGTARPPTGDLSLAKVSPAASGGRDKQIPRIFVKDGSPFRLIQGYASDDSGEDDKREFIEDASPIRVSPTAAVGTSGLFEDEGFKLSSNFGLKKTATEIGSALQADSSQLSPSTAPKDAAEFCSSSPSCKAISSSVISYSHVDAKNENVDLDFHQQDDFKQDNMARTFEPSHDNDSVEGESIGVDHHVGKFHPEDDAKRDSTMLNVDELGRLIREGASESDYDGIHYNERHGKRGRSWSRSRSPQESRKGHSPRRRKDERSQSRSCSPKRSRSKSPLAFRRTEEFARWNRGQPRECILKGMVVDECNDVLPEEAKCPEMQACQESSVGRFQTMEGRVLDEKVVLRSVIDDTESTARTGVGQSQVTGYIGNDKGSQDATNQMSKLLQVEHMWETPNINPIEDERAQPPSETSQAVSADSLSIQPSLACKSQSLPDEIPLSQPPLGEVTVSQPSQTTSPSTSLHEPQKVVPQFSQPLPVPIFQSTIFQSQAPVSQAYPSQIPMRQLYSNQYLTNQPPTQSLPPKGCPPSNLSAPHIHSQPSQLPPPPAQGHPPSFLPPDNLNASFTSQPPRENVLAQATSYQPQTPSLDRFPSHRPFIAGEYYSSSVPPNATWTDEHPLQPSQVNELPTRPAVPTTDFPHLQFQQNALPPKNDFTCQPLVRPYPHGQLAHPQVFDFHPQRFHSLESSHQPPLQLDELRRWPLPMGHQQDQPFGGPSFSREEQFPRYPMAEGPNFMSDSQRDRHLHHPSFVPEEVRNSFPSQGFASSSSFLQDNSRHTQPMPFPRESLPNQPHSFPRDSLLPRYFSKEDFPTAARELPYFHHLPPYGEQRPASSNFSSNFAAPSMVDSLLSRYPSSLAENNLPPHLSYGGVPKMSTSAHYNPFASTFEQAPASSRFGCSASEREENTRYSSNYNSSFSSGNVLVGGHESRIIASPLNSRRSGEQFLLSAVSSLPVASSGESLNHAYAREPSVEVVPDVQKQFAREPVAGDQYDPLFDSIEPSPNMLKKFGHVQELNLVDDAGTVSKLRSLHRPTDVEENNRQKGRTAVTKSEVDELCEAATDAEVGAVEDESPQLGDGKDWSPGMAIDMGNTAAGEIKIDQVQSHRKSKKIKDSKSMKLFKITLADFVKEVLKPSWRQGNISKEEFKAIVKKTVYKVSGTMPSHQIPKTQVKINQYVESSQQKLTKLVMGYVDKYVKM